jgi:hypothetical protein
VLRCEAKKELISEASTSNVVAISPIVVARVAIKVEAPSVVCTVLSTGPIDARSNEPQSRVHGSALRVVAVTVLGVTHVLPLLLRRQEPMSWRSATTSEDGFSYCFFFMLVVCD